MSATDGHVISLQLHHPRSAVKGDALADLGPRVLPPGSSHPWGRVLPHHRAGQEALFLL